MSEESNKFETSKWREMVTSLGAQLKKSWFQWVRSYLLTPEQIMCRLHSCHSNYLRQTERETETVVLSLSWMYRLRSCSSLKIRNISGVDNLTKASEYLDVIFRSDGGIDFWLKKSCSCSGLFFGGSWTHQTSSGAAFASSLLLLLTSRLFWLVRQTTKCIRRRTFSSPGLFNRLINGT